MSSHEEDTAYSFRPHDLAHRAAVDTEERVNILLVDDNASKLLALESILADLGQNLVKARSAQEALLQLLRRDFAVILLDVHMPSMDGFEAAELIRGRKRSAHIPIIFVSAVNQSDMHAFKGYALGAVDYIHTPIPEVLRAKVSVFVELFKKTRALQRQTEAIRALNADLEQRVEERTATLARANAELRQRNAELDAFAHAVSHDLKEPLRGIHTTAQFLLEDYTDTLDDDGRQRLGTLGRLTQRMERLLDSLLDYASIGRMDLARTEVNVDEILKQSLELVSGRLKEAGTNVRLHGPLGIVPGDAERLTEVFTNLLSNAIKYNDKVEKWVDVGVQTPHTPGEPLIFYVRDNGIGIAPEHFDTIFAIFRRLHPRDAFGGGVGVGLTMVKRIVERHGGRIWLDSTPDEGTTFYFTLQ